MKILLIHSENSEGRNVEEVKQLAEGDCDIIESSDNIDEVLDHIEVELPDMIYIDWIYETPFIYLTGINKLSELNMANKFNVKTANITTEIKDYNNNLIKAIDNSIRINRLKRLISNTID